MYCTQYTYTLYKVTQYNNYMLTIVKHMRAVVHTMQTLCLPVCLHYVNIVDILFYLFLLRENCLCVSICGMFHCVGYILCALVYCVYICLSIYCVLSIIYVYI